MIREYEEFVDNNFKFTGEELRNNELLQKLAYCGLGLSGEAGECSDAIKKLVRGNIWGHYDPTVIKTNILKELGDTLYYATKIAHLLGYSVEAIMSINQEKLEYRNKVGKMNEDFPKVA